MTSPSLPDGDRSSTDDDERVEQARWAQLAQIADGPDMFLAALVLPVATADQDNNQDNDDGQDRDQDGDQDDSARARPDLPLTPHELLDRLAHLSLALRTITERRKRLMAVFRSGLPALVLRRIGCPADTDGHDAQPRLDIGTPADSVPDGLLRTGTALHTVCARVLAWTRQMEKILALARRDMAPDLRQAAGPGTGAPSTPSPADAIAGRLRSAANRQDGASCAPGLAGTAADRPVTTVPDELRLWDIYTGHGRYHLCHPGDRFWPAGRFGDLQQPVLTDEATATECAPPLCLWVEGDPALLGNDAIAIVGSRLASRYGLDVTAECARVASGSGYTVITGGAMGVDGCANRAACDLGYPSVAVFAGGLDTTGPARNLPLFEQIVRGGGALVSEVPPWVVPRSYRFLERNRLIAALSDGVLVTQARYRSGALNTAGWARRIGRPVIVVPGPITDPASGGCNAQLRAAPEIRPQVLTRAQELPRLVEEGLTANQLEQIRLRQAAVDARTFGRRQPDTHGTPAGHAQDKPHPTKYADDSCRRRHSETIPAEDLLTAQIIDRLRSRRQDASQLYADLLARHPGVSISQVLAALARLEADGRVSVDEAGRASLLER